MPEAGVGSDLTAAVGVAGRHTAADPPRDLRRHLRGADAGREDQDVVPDAHLAVGPSVSLEGHLDSLKFSDVNPSRPRTSLKPA